MHALYHDKLLSHFDVGSKVLFSGCDSNLISLEGKLLEMEEVYLLSSLSIDYIY